MGAAVLRTGRTAPTLARGCCFLLLLPVLSHAATTVVSQDSPVGCVAWDEGETHRMFKTQGRHAYACFYFGSLPMPVTGSILSRRGAVRCAMTGYYEPGFSGGGSCLWITYCGRNAWIGDGCVD
jgi:hypothetical protein